LAGIILSHALLESIRFVMSRRECRDIYGLINSLGVVRNSLHRVFNRGSFSLGGRFYGPWCQNIPQELRPFITIDERPTIELDYPRLHPTLLYAEADQRLCGDAYEISGWDRRLVKIAFNTLVNADTRVAAIRSIAREIGGQGAYRKAEQLVQAIEAKHQPIASAFGTGAGLRLMRRDSGMTERIMLQLVRKGVVVLPIHDSYIVPHGTKTKGELMEAMASALHRFAGKSAVGAGACTKNIPQYGDKSVVSSVAVFVFFPDLPQRDFFGGDRLAIPARCAGVGRRGDAAPETGGVPGRTAPPIGRAVALGGSGVPIVGVSPKKFKSCWLVSGPNNTYDPLDGGTALAPRRKRADPADRAQREQRRFLRAGSGAAARSRQAHF
jgi:hypothetical protein